MSCSFFATVNFIVHVIFYSVKLTGYICMYICLRCMYTLSVYIHVHVHVHCQPYMYMHAQCTCTYIKILLWGEY